MFSCWPLRPKSVGGHRAAKVQWEGIDAAGQVIRLDTKAFFVGVDEIPESPRVGDRIIHIENGKRLTYEVIKPSLTDNCWNWADRLQRTRRIHANLVSAD